MATTGAQKVHAIFKVKAEGRTRLVVFDTQDLSLGRSPENDLAIDDPEISRKHCVFKRTPQGCVVEDMGTSNGTEVNGESVDHAALSHGTVIRVGEVEITFAETTRNPVSLGPSVEYASQLKSFSSPLAGGGGDGEATMLGLMDTLSPGDDEFEVRPAGEFAYDLHDMQSPAAARDLDAELETLDADPIEEFDFDAASGGGGAPAAARGEAAPVSTQVWELDDASLDESPSDPAEAKAEPEAEAEAETARRAAAPPTPGPAADPAAESRRLTLTLEIDGVEGELRRILEGLAGKLLELPPLRVRVKSDDLG